MLLIATLFAILSFDLSAKGQRQSTVIRNTKKFQESAALLPVHNVDLQPAPVQVEGDESYNYKSIYYPSLVAPAPLQKSMSRASGAYGYYEDIFSTDVATELALFQKRGLKFVDLNTGGGSYNREFLETHQKFLTALLGQTTYSVPDISDKWKAFPGERPFRTAKLYTRWKSVDCSALDMRLKMAGSIYDGVKNRVIKLADSISKKTFAYKTYSDPDEFYAELEVFMWIDHPYFVKPHCHRKDTATGRAGILFEYVEGKPSHHYARDATPAQLQLISAQLLVAMEHLHWLGIIHADLKPENVLIRADGTVQVIDMGFAVHLPQARRGRGTRTTMAPELVNLVPGKVHEGVDWWAYGSTIAMWYGANLAYSNEDGKRFIPMYMKDHKYTVGSIPWKFDTDLRNFLHIFFQAHPELRRLNTKRLLRQLRSHAFFDRFDWTQVYGGLLE